ncbi:protein translocase subunit SecDF [Verrucomicrobium spinosum]|uniref:protein translocase subunit SecDF n=1 Tax=Verrucomicrobium spinosum TaxID=2736 RepID=UPI0001746BF5|nr:protein translocase subunit SecDF [Verrucomicrobium spinosum]
MNTPQITFIWGAVLLFLLFYYLGTTIHRTKKIIGTVLTLGVSGFCIWAFAGLGIKKGIDLGGGSSFTVQLQPSLDDKGQPVPLSPAAVQQAIGILEKRLNPDGGKDLLTAPQGTDRILIQMPGVHPDEVGKIRETIQKVAHLEFRLVHPQGESALAQMKATGQPVIGYTELPGAKDKDGKREVASYLVKSRADLEGEHVVQAWPALNPEGWVIHLKLDSAGSKIFADLTSAHIGENLAIIVDGEVLSAPTLRSAITGGNAEISGKFTQEEAQELASGLENPLKNPMKIIEESNVSAAFGEQTIQQGIQTGWVSTLLVALFMLIYYRFAGLIALVGLVVCMLLVFGAMALFNFTLTMPGIAGIVLTIGMAVDANVLIYERLREEMNAGKTLGAALDAAFEKAFSAIFDANITTLISAVILFYLATGLVKGFAVTLTVGIVGTLLGALIVTRVCFNWFIDANLLKKITVTHIIPEGKYDLLKWSKPFVLGSFGLALLSILVFPIKGTDAIGIDFRGGAITRFEVAAGKTVETEGVEKFLKESNIQGAFVQASSNATANLITVRSEYDDGPKVKEILESKYAGELSGGQTDRVGSIVGKELATRSAIAYCLAMLAIFIYLVIFYELAFAVAAIVALFHDCVIAIGLSVLFGQQLSVIHIGAILTVAGYSINDTIIVFDRIREMLRTHRGSIRDIMNEAISATLSRTLLTSLTVLMSMVVLFFFGGPSMKEFALPIIIGVVVGTYSSIYIASSLVLWYGRVTGRGLQRHALDDSDTPAKAPGAAA